MSKRLILGGLVVFVVLGVFAGVATIFSPTKHTVCTKFIGYVRNNDATNSYGLYAASVKGELTQTDWKQQVSNLSTAYGKGGQLKLISKPSTDGSPTLETYTLKTTDGNFELTCSLTGTGKQQELNGFSSAKQ